MQISVMSLQLKKINSGLCLTFVVGHHCIICCRHNYVQINFESTFKPSFCWMPWGPVSSKTLQSTIAAANTEVNRVAGHGCLYSKRDKGFWPSLPHETTVSSLSIATLQMDHEYCVSLQTSILSITGVQTFMYTHKLCMKCHSHEFFDCLDHKFLNWENFC